MNWPSGRKEGPTAEGEKQGRGRARAANATPFDAAERPAAATGAQAGAVARRRRPAAVAARPTQRRPPPWDLKCCRPVSMPGEEPPRDHAGASPLSRSSGHGSSSTAPWTLGRERLINDDEVLCHLTSLLQYVQLTKLSDFPIVLHR
jgi:hypothetical protein